MEHLLQAKPSQAKPSQATPNDTFSFTILIVHKTPFLEKSVKGVFCLGLKRQRFYVTDEETGGPLVTA